MPDATNGLRAYAMKAVRAAFTLIVLVFAGLRSLWVQLTPLVARLAAGLWRWGRAKALEIGASPEWERLTLRFRQGSARLSRSFASTEPTPKDFLPGLVRLQEAPPSPLGRTVMRVLLGFMAVLIVWGFVGKVDIVAVTTGKLVPQSYLKVVQPAESGIVKEILVREGEHVAAGQVLMRMDTVGSDADLATVTKDIQRKELTIRMIDADLNNASFVMEHGDDPELFREVQAQLQANRADLEAKLAAERALMEKSRGELAASRAVKTKLSETLPQYVAQEKAHAKLSQEGYVPALAAGEKRRERIEKEQELRTQEHMIEAGKANVEQSQRKLEQILSEYRRNLHQQRNDIQGQLDKLKQELAKQEHRQDLMELKASHAGTVKDLATHTIGTVTQPGAVLLTIVPDGETLKAEVWVTNQDRGFVHPGQKVQLKFAAYPFQKYGMVEGTVEYVSADATEQNSQSGTTTSSTTGASSHEPLAFRALISLKDTHLQFDGDALPLASGMQVNAEIIISNRSVIEYFLSPVQKVVHESGRER